jgi:hypothetical protein
MAWLRRIIGIFFPTEDQIAFREALRRSQLPQPSSAPPPAEKYILHYSQPGFYDIYDGEKRIGDIFKQDSDEDHYAVWSVTLGEHTFDFNTLKEAKSWLGAPPVRRYR